MTTKLETALKLASKGFFIFPLSPNSKIPAIKDFPRLATTDIEQIQEWWTKRNDWNIGLSTTNFGDGSQALIAVDIDCKEGKKGFESALKLELEGLEFPKTFYQQTPTGGQHLIFRAEKAIKQGVNVLGDGLDIRSDGGYLVGAGSIINGREYTLNDIESEVVPVPLWVLERCGGYRATKTVVDPILINTKIDLTRAYDRAKDYLLNRAPLAIQGHGGDHETYKVACAVKDFGVTEDLCLSLMDKFWNERCNPPWDLGNLFTKIRNAYAFGGSPPGISAPEASFDELPKEDSRHPVVKFNDRFAYVATSGSPIILYEHAGSKKDPARLYLSIAGFKTLTAAETIINANGKQTAIHSLWLKSPDRRSYDGFCFNPGRETNPKYYNFWKGFKYPLPKEGEIFTQKAKQSLIAFREHLEMNVCGGDKSLGIWLTTYFAHLVQRPWELPQVCLVFRGEKGVGKNALVDRVGALLGSHYFLTSNRRYMLGNFNAHLENTLLFVLDEAFWSGDKQAEGTLKDLITGPTNTIEHKGHEAFVIDNHLRVVIIGNENWLVPASDDERRYAVFDVGSGRKQDTKFFKNMRLGMEEGGYKLLLEYLMKYPLDAFEVSVAPKTEALFDQKIQSLNLFSHWLYECLREGKILGSTFNDTADWPLEIGKDEFRASFQRQTNNRNEYSARKIGEDLKRFIPSIVSNKKIVTDLGRKNCYTLPPLEVCRNEFAAKMNHHISWPE